MNDKPTLLIAEDDINIQDLIATVFNQYFSLVQVSDGEAAIQRIQSQKVDVAILDINIPKKNGLQVLTAIQKLDGSLRPATVVLSGDCTSTTVNRAYESGADAFIANPFDLLPLHKEVMNLVLNVKSGANQDDVLA